jgi:RNA polymerase sigma-70 factor (ECF subfamily)
MTAAPQTSLPLADNCPVRSLRLCLTRRKGESVPKRQALTEEQCCAGDAVLDEDAVLARCTAKGNTDAYKVLVQRHLPRVMAVSRRMLGDDSHAEEAAQEAMLRLWTHAGSYDPQKAKLTTWLTRITVNICLDRLRKRSDEVWPENFDVALPASQDRSVMEAQVASKVDAALQKLPERQRLAMVLCHYEEMSMAEAASVMEATPEAIESLLSRAREAFRERFELLTRTVK